MQGARQRSSSTVVRLSRCKHTVNCYLRGSGCTTCMHCWGPAVALIGSHYAVVPPVGDTLHNLAYMQVLCHWRSKL